MAQINVPIEMNEELKAQVDELCEELGLDFETAVNIFAQKMVNEQGVPFEVTEKDYPADEEKCRKCKIIKLAAVFTAIGALAASLAILFAKLKKKD
jgi:DNA-damage-inducible protein J